MAAKGVEKEVEVSGVQSRLRVYETEEDPPDGMSDLEVDVYETIKTIRDPEFPYTLGQLRVITPDGVQVHEKPGLTPLITVTFRPTVAHCAMAQQIGLCIRSKLEREFGHDRYKIDIFVAEGSHNDSAGITKQINDKERVSAALENPMIVKMVRAAIEDPY
ncbi:unnamed protein product [Vitrella brassicaformis CCMP3155]|uniref:Uncharacterized protein n=1 Tax=Vitrella brassicaformis (strain CCMP3155) TaxID=1169540 RepID=A0A0G4EF36_VITBC|nr:unnamed protein product [Vitrella brassicaformis CCMP3155]|eukprot:CEL94571.1 unnamed protein product [Vitrella brassicaformis CCMP3155]